jgi:GNAT superfamily N-acetyltransferase
MTVNRATVAVLTPEEIRQRLDEIAALRIEVFRAFPYLYDGDLAYERGYLSTYLDSEGSIVVGAFDGERLIGCATGAPMEDHADAFAAPLAAAGIDPKNVWYCGESVLKPEYRGQGIGHAFFDHREAQGRALGRTWSVFCSVIRPADHPLRPVDYRPLDAFWTKRGYAKLEGAVARFPWRDIGAEEETEKPMSVWIRRL